MERSDWITETATPQGVVFLIRQRRAVALRILRTLGIMMAALIVMTAMTGVYADHHAGPGGSGGTLTVVLIILDVLCAMFVLGMGGPLLAIYISTKDWSEFCITSDSIFLVRKLKSSYPDCIDRDHVSQFFVFTPQGPSQTLTVSVTTIPYSAGLIGSVGHGINQASSGLQQAAAGVAQILARNNCGIRVNVRGSEIPLAAALSPSEAEFLFFRLKNAFGRGATASYTEPGAQRSGVASLPPSPTRLPHSGSVLKDWLWLPVAVLAVLSLRWIVPALEPIAPDAQNQAASARAVGEQRQRIARDAANFEQQFRNATDRDPCGVTRFLISGEGVITPNTRYRNSAAMQFVDVGPGRRYPVQGPLMLCKVPIGDHYTYIVADRTFNETLRRSGARHAFVFLTVDWKTERYSAEANRDSVSDKGGESAALNTSATLSAPSQPGSAPP